MKAIRVLFAAAVVSIGVWSIGLTGAHAAGAGAQSYTQVLKNQTDVSSDVNPCSGVTGTLSQTYNGVFHITTLADGELWATFTQTGSISFVPDDASQPSYSGHFTVWGGFNVNERNSTDTFTFSARLTGTDGSVVVLHEVQHDTYTANGTPVVSFDRPTLTCG